MSKESEEELTPGDIAWIVCIKTYQKRPLFFDWNFRSLGESSYTLLDPSSVVTVLSRTIVSPYDKTWRFRKVLTCAGVGFVWEEELRASKEEADAVAERIF